MSRLFGEIRQIAFVVRDIDQAMPYWARTRRTSRRRSGRLFIALAT
ncbi:hypothetical protein [Alkalilimnicola ehrlichii]|nr:hypothetical protein [Alkalilimnicola ehrlichii]